MSFRSFSQFEVDQLKELVNIGTGKAYTSLSKLLDRTIQMGVPEPFIDSLEKMHQHIGDSKDRVLAIFLRTEGDLSGSLLVVFTPESALNIAKILTKTPKENVELLDQTSVSALLEIGNILLGSAATTFAQFLGLEVIHTVPDIATDMLGAIMDAVLVETGKDLENNLAIKVKLQVPEEEIFGDMYYLFDQNSSEVILAKTKQKI